MCSRGKLNSQKKSLGKLNLPKKKNLEENCFASKDVLGENVIYQNIVLMKNWIYQKKCSWEKLSFATKKISWGKFKLY